MDFFRKYQRIILYTAGIFALVSFSIGGPLMDLFAGLQQRDMPTPSMTIDGREVKVTAEDYEIGQALAARDERRGDFVVAIPPLLDPEGNDNRVEVYAALRRLAIDYGVEYSDDETDRAIQQALSVASPLGATSVADLARFAGYGSIAELRRVVGEALRVGTFVRLQALGVDTTDASLAAQIVRDVELLTLQVARLDEKALQTAIEQADVTDETLRAWIDTLSRDDQNARGFLDRPRYRIDVASLDLNAFDAAAFATELGDKTFSDDEVSQYYELNKFRLYQKEMPVVDPPVTPVPEPEYLPLDDALKLDIRKRLQAEAVMRSVWDTVTARLEAHVKAETEAVTAAMTAVNEAQQGVATAMEKAALPAATDADKAAVATAEAAVAEAKTKVTAAETALKDKRGAFDLAAVVTELAAGRAGLAVTDSGEALLDIEKLQDLAPIAPWPGSAAVGALALDRPLSTQVQRSKSHVFQIRLRAFEEAPLKKFEDLRDKARGDWFTMKSGEAAAQKSTDFEAKLKELARAKIPERIAELEKQRDEKLVTRLKEWRDGLEGKLAAAKTSRDFHEKRDAKSQAYRTMAAEVTRLEAELATEEAQRTLILAELQKSTDDAIAKSSKEKYPEVLAEAAQAFGFEVETLGPYPRDLFAAGRSRDAYGESVKFLWGNSQVTAQKVGEATDLLSDPTNRKRYLAVATKVDKGSLADVTRRELLNKRAQAGQQRAAGAILQSFSREALEKRYGWKRPVEAVVNPKPSGS